MLTKKQINFYKEKGYLLVENVITKKQLNKINDMTNKLIEKSRKVKSSNKIFDLDEGHSPTNPRLTRIKQPHKVDSYFWKIIFESKIKQILIDLLGKNISLKTSKLNSKFPNGGAHVDWHQDWVFYPHTNDDVLALGLMLNDVNNDNGPLMVIPESHIGPVLSHENSRGEFCGAIDPKDKDFDIKKAIPLLGTAGSITIHHSRLLHGSAKNRSKKNRMILFYECNSTDAWPLVGAGAYLNSTSPSDLWSQFKNQIVCGDVCLTPRMEKIPVRVPLPPPPDHGSIFATQKSGNAKSVFK